MPRRIRFVSFSDFISKPKRKYWIQDQEESWWKWNQKAMRKIWRTICFYSQKQQRSLGESCVSEERKISEFWQDDLGMSSTRSWNYSSMGNIFCSSLNPWIWREKMRTKALLWEISIAASKWKVGRFQACQTIERFPNVIDCGGRELSKFKPIRHADIPIRILPGQGQHWSTHKVHWIDNTKEFVRWVFFPITLWTLFCKLKCSYCMILLFLNC